MIYIIGNQLTHYLTVFVVLTWMESQGIYAVVIIDSYWDVQKFQVGEVCIEFRQSIRFYKCIVALGVFV
jgi:hypothetical protein